MLHDWESLIFLLSIALNCIQIATILHDVLLYQSGQGMVTFASQSLQKSLSFNKYSKWIYMNT